ncbi:MAG: hypothetical protein ACK4PK_10175 [Alphaproteobacteria bacterium]|jgi:hypothetical protein
MTTRELMSAATVLMLLAGTPVLAMAEDAAPAVEETTEAPADDATTTDEGAADEEATEEAPAE